MKLSPKTAARVQAVATLGPDVTKTTLAEHEKALSSAEASVMKALQLLNKLSAELEAQREKDAAKESRACEIRARRTKDMEKVKKAARQQGKHEADQAWSLLVDWNNHLSHRVNWHVEEWSGSVWQLAGCRNDVMLAQAVECPGLLPESEELLQAKWNACKPLWFRHPVDELADRLKGALASQPDKTVGNQVCFQRKVPLQAQDVPLDLHELFPMIGPLAEDLFSGEERLALAFLQLHKQDMAVLRGYMQLRRMDAGPVWSSVSVGDMNFGRFMYVYSGRMFVAMLPFDVFDKAVLEGETLGQVATRMGNYSIHEVLELGGSYVLLEEGDGCHCPPGYLTFQCTWGYMYNADPATTDEDSGSSCSKKLSYLSIITLPQGLFRNEPQLQLARRRMALCRDSCKTPDQVKLRQMGDAGLELVGYLLPGIELEVKPEPAGSPALRLAPDHDHDAISIVEAGGDQGAEEISGENAESKHPAADATAQESSGAEPKQSAAEREAQEISGEDAEPKHSAAVPDVHAQEAEADATLWAQLETQQKGLPPKVRIDYDDVPADLHGFLAQDEADVEYELGRARAHPKFEEHLSYIKTELDVDDDYEFGSDDCIADLEFWFEWLQNQKKDAAKHKREESLMPVIPVPKPTSIEMPDQSEPDEASKALAQLKQMQESSRKRAEAAAAKGKPKASAKHPKSPKPANPKAKSNQTKGKSNRGNK
ncbi:PREP1 [Symbiodinium sp. CCMP2456]|nr:PREP1 [Symbiodinium sp. CCMP2456]